MYQMSALNHRKDLQQTCAHLLYIGWCVRTNFTEFSGKVTKYWGTLTVSCSREYIQVSHLKGLSTETGLLVILELSIHSFLHHKRGIFSLVAFSNCSMYPQWQKAKTKAHQHVSVLQCTPNAALAKPVLPSDRLTKHQQFDENCSMETTEKDIQQDQVWIYSLETLHSWLLTKTVSTELAKWIPHFPQFLQVLLVWEILSTTVCVAILRSLVPR